MVSLHVLPQRAGGVGAFDGRLPVTCFGSAGPSRGATVGRRTSGKYAAMGQGSDHSSRAGVCLHARMLVRLYWEGGTSRFSRPKSGVEISGRCVNHTGSSTGLGAGPNL